MKCSLQSIPKLSLISVLRRLDLFPAGDITFSSKVSVKNLVLLGAINDLDLVAILSDAVRLKDTAVTITGKKTLMAGLTFENLHIELLNGQRLDHFLASVVTRNMPHTQTGAVRVRGTIVAPWVTAQQLVVQVCAWWPVHWLVCGI